MLAGGHQVIPGALGRGCGQDGSGDLQEAVLGHGLAQGGDHVAAQDDVLLHGGVAQIQVAVLETLHLVRVPAAVDFKGQLVVAAAAQDLHLLGDDLDIAGGLLGVLAGPLAHRALHGNGGLLGDGPEGGHHIFGLGHDLGSAVEVADDHEGQVSAHHAHVLHPADDLHILSRVLQPELSAGMRTVLCHIQSPFQFRIPNFEFRIIPL